MKTLFTLIYRIFACYLVFCLGLSQSPKLLDFNSKLNHLSPTSIVSPLVVKKGNLTPVQVEIIKQVFLNSELKEVLDRLVGRMLVNLGGRLESDIIALSQIQVNHEAGQKQKKGRKPKRRGRSKKGKKTIPLRDKRSLQDWFNASVTEHLLREIRIQEITYRNKKRLEGKLPEEIEKYLKEVHQVMPSEGIHIYLVKGNYVLSFKKLIFILHQAPITSIEAFADILKKGKLVFSEKPESNLGGYHLTTFEMSDKLKKSIVRQWSHLGLVENPTPEMRETQSILEGFIPYLLSTVELANDDLGILLGWVLSPEKVSDSSKPAQQHFYESLKEWRQATSIILADVKKFQEMPNKTTTEVISKITAGRDFLTSIRTIVEEVLSEITRKEGILHINEGLLSRFDEEKIKAETYEETPKESLDGVINSLDNNMVRIGRMLTRLGKRSDISNVNITELIKRIMGLNEWHAKINFTDLVFDSNDVGEISTLAYPLELELTLDRKLKEVIKTIGRSDRGESDNNLIEIEIRNKEGNNPFILIRGIARNNGNPSVSVQRRINLKDSNGNGNGNGKSASLKLKSLQRSAISTTISSIDFQVALKQYLNGLKVEDVSKFLPSELMGTLYRLNTFADYKLSAIADLLGKQVEDYIDKFLTQARIKSNDSLKLNRNTSLREVADKTGLRLSELLELLEIPPKKEEKASVRFIILKTHDKNGKRIRHITPFLERHGKKKNVKDNELIFLRLITQDAAGNVVEQLVVDKYARLKRYSDTLGTSASFNKFLFNARRTFDVDAREIIFDEIYLDPQARGYGKKFHDAQIKSMSESGFDGTRVREDAISIVTLKWLAGYKIDWERLAFKGRWLQMMSSLFKELGITVTSEHPSTEELKNALKHTKMRSESFKKYLEMKFGSVGGAVDLVDILIQSDENGFLEFLRFRLLGYGRRKVRVQKLKEALNSLPEEAKEEKELGLDALRSVEEKEANYWYRIKEADQKLNEGLAKSNLSQDSYKPDFSPGSPDRIASFKKTEALLHKYEFGLSLVGRLTISKTSDASRERRIPLRLKGGGHLDDHLVLDSMQPYLLKTGETVAPHFIAELMSIDRENSRYDHFWKPEWDKPTQFLLNKAKEFHDLVQRAEIHTLNRVSNRIYLPQISKMFFSFPVVREMLARQDGALGVGHLLSALFYFNPQLVGIILRSSQNNLVEARQALSHLPDSMIAKILDLEVIPVPSNANDREAFEKNDQFHILSLLEPNEVYHSAYSRRVKKVIRYLNPRTLAILFQQSHALYKENLDEGWFKSILIAAVKEMERDPHFLNAKKYIADKDGLNDPVTWLWVHAYFDRETKRLKPWNVARFLSYAKPKLKSEDSQTLLGMIYNQQDIYGPFMQHYGGFVDLRESVTGDSALFNHDAATVLSQMVQSEEGIIGLEIAGIIIRSTATTQDRQTYEILARLARLDVEALIKILNADLYFIPMDKIDEFRKINRFVYLIFIRSMLVNSWQDNSILSKDIVRTILNSLEPKSIAALIQYMWINYGNGRFSGVEDNLERMMSVIDVDKQEEILSFIKDFDREEGTRIERWYTRAMGEAGYPLRFYKELNAQYPWVDQDPGKRMFLSYIVSQLYEELKKAAQSEIKIQDVLKNIEIDLNRLVQGVGEIEFRMEAMLAYGKIKRELNRLQIDLMKYYDDKELTPSLKVPFLFHILEPKLDEYFEEQFLKIGLAGFEGVNSSSNILRVKVFEDTQENGSKFRDLRLGDLLITNGLPENDPNIKKPGGILQGIPVSTNGHAYELANELGIPFGFLHEAHKTLKFLDGKIVVFEVDDHHVTLRLAIEDEIKSYEDNPNKNKQVSALTRLEIPEVSLGDEEPYVLNFRELEPKDRTRVGFKAVRLARLKQAGKFSIPDSFSITFAGYEAFLKENHISETLEILLEGIDTLDENAVSKRLAEVRRKFTFGSFPSKMIKEIETQLAELGEAPLFIRSSSNVEDLPGFSGAGRLDSFGPVDNNLSHVLTKVRDVMLSLWKERAFYNRKAHAIKEKDHLRAKVSELIQTAIDAKYSGLFSTHYQGDKNKIQITIDEKIKGGVEDLVEGRTAPTLIYDQETGELVRQFENHPLFWKDSEIGLAQLMTKIKGQSPQLSDSRAKEIVLSTIHMNTNKLTEYLMEVFEYPDELRIGAETMAGSLKVQLKAIDQQQIENIFKRLYEVGKEIEETLVLSPILVEFAIDKDGAVVPLQVKGHEGARKISFKVQVLNKYGLHARPATNLTQLLFESSGGKKVLKTNSVKIRKEGEDKEYKFDGPFGAIVLGAGVGDILNVTVSGKDALEIGKIIRHFFMNLCNDYDNEEELKDPGNATITWEEAQEIFGSYAIEDDHETVVSWGDLDELFEIYQKAFAHQLQAPSEELDTAI